MPLWIFSKSMPVPPLFSSLPFPLPQPNLSYQRLRFHPYIRFTQTDFSLTRALCDITVPRLFFFRLYTGANLWNITSNKTGGCIGGQGFPIGTMARDGSRHHFTKHSSFVSGRKAFVIIPTKVEASSMII
jgi:hypothetical protein